MADAYSGPVPKPTPETKPFWEGTRQRTLRIQRCRDCERFYFYPRPLCPHCLSRNVEWRPVSGRGRLHTFVINHRLPRNYPLPAPVIIGIVELDEGPRLLSNVIGIEPDPQTVRCDMRVEVVFEDITAEITLPRFKPLRA